MWKHLAIGLSLALSGLIGSTAGAQVITQAFVPETGFYWNSGQPGRGYAIEIQDRLVFMTIYTYTEEGSPVLREPLWFSANGTLVSSGSGNQVVYEFNDELYFSEDGQCLGCPFPGEPLTSPTGRSIRLTFDSVRRGELDIDGEIIPIERFWYSNSILDTYQALQGQWLIVTDCTAPVQNNCYPSHPTIQPFEADLLNIDTVSGSGNARTAEGFRPGTLIDVAAAYQQEDDVYIIVVSEIDNEFLAYYFFGPDFGTDQFRGLAERYTPGSNLSGDGFPVQGRRISDLTFAQTALPAAKRRSSTDRVTPRVSATPPGKPLATAPEARINPAQLAAINGLARRLEGQLKQRAEARR